MQKRGLPRGLKKQPNTLHNTVQEPCQQDPTIGLRSVCGSGVAIRGTRRLAAKRAVRICDRPAFARD
eukprot:2287199-Alexandrium_andersonii.AAC.1